VVIDCKGKYIYPSFIDVYSDYGMATPKRLNVGLDFFRSTQFSSNTKGAYGWNQAVKPETNASKLFTIDTAKAKNYRSAGFGTMLTHVKDGIARGTGAVVTLSEISDNFSLLKEEAAAFYSFNKGTSTQSYPTSMMGSIALLRQTYLDAQWYKNKPATEGTNLSLEAWLNNQSLPQIFEANDKWNVLRADRIGDEFGVQYIIKAGGNEYQRMKEMAATKATFILPVNFQPPMDVEDPNDARMVSLAEMKHWELAPTNLAAFEKAGIPFCITAADLRDPKMFLPNLRKAMDVGLSEKKALEALTTTPATLLNIYDKVGSIEKGKLANFIITSAPVFAQSAVILQNWIQGEKYAVNENEWNDVKGYYALEITSGNQRASYVLEVKSNNTANVIAKDTFPAKFNFDGKMVKLSFSLQAKPSSRSAIKKDSTSKPTSQYRLSGFWQANAFTGNGEDTLGNAVLWSAVFNKAITKQDTAKKQMVAKPLAKITYPFSGYGFEELPKAETMLIKNATVWTNEQEGILPNTDVLVKDGKIAKIGKNLSDASAKVIDGTGKYLTPGIIDEHSHIAASSINEGAQSVTSEVRIGDNLNPDDINIYRQLAGGVTTSHILHGSANTIGGQTQLIKLRWGADDEELKFENAPPFIKFALGENVKRTASSSNNRFPDTRMGVEQVLNDAFARTKDYEAAMKADPQHTRRDLELDALSEVMHQKRFVTCHSYVQSEIVATMRIAEKFGFRINTFTHILEGYKVADKMKQHGANVSTFSDWWAYKLEVQDAIAYNAAIMQKVGLNVCINSDDAEMARRLNQEAAKTIKYGGISEEEAFKMVTLNPAKALHIDNRVGSIKVGKDADLVLWSHNPLSIYAVAEKTIIDGKIYFDRQRDSVLRKQIAAERHRLVEKMLGEKKSGALTRPAEPSWQIILGCDDHAHHEGIITIDGNTEEDLNSKQHSLSN
jgi:imidazolonepropionase-like amidohydrolase